MQNSTRTIIIATACLLFLSVSFLAYTSNRQQDYNYSRSWWVAYFSDPKSADLSFTIENHLGDSNFHWEILADKTSVAKGDENLKLGETKNIPQPKIETAGKKITIKITTGKTTKELYKTF